VEGEARPRVQVEQDEIAGRRRDRVAPVDLEAEGGGGPPGQVLEPLGVEGMPRYGLVLVVEPPEPRGPVRRADAVELHEVAVDVRLQHGASDAASAELAEGLLDGAGALREDHVAVPRVVHVGALHPHGPSEELTGGARSRNHPAFDEGDRRRLEPRDHPLAIRGEHGGGAVDVDDARALPGPERGQHVLALAHQEDAPGPHRRGAAHVLRVLQVDLVAARLEMLSGQAEDLGVVALATRRMRAFTEDPPATRVRHAVPPAALVVPARAGVSAGGPSSAGWTSMTVGMISP